MYTFDTYGNLPTKELYERLTFARVQVAEIGEKLKAKSLRGARIKGKISAGIKVKPSGYMKLSLWVLRE